MRAQLKRENNTSKKNGFTLIEMLIVVTIIGILTSIVIPRLKSSKTEATKNAHRAERLTINNQLETYFFLNGEYPATDEAGTQWDLDAWTNIEGDVDQYFPDGIPPSCNQKVKWNVVNGRIIKTTQRLS